MRDLSDLKAQGEGQGFQFPGVFELTALGRADAALPERMPDILAAAGVRVVAGSLRTKPSREGNYVSVSVSFECESREQYDAAHEALRKTDGVRWTL